MRALVVTKDADEIRANLNESFNEDDLMAGDVLVDIEYSSINFKDGLAITGRPGIIHTFPLIPGIDLVGTVAESTHADWEVGDQVILNGWGVGEGHHGGLAERARVNGDWLIPLPGGMSTAHAAAIGTAGYTAMLSVLALEKSGAMTGGDILVTGAAGGVGSIAISLLAALGHRVVASTGRPQERDYLESLGASEIIDRLSLSEPGKPLQSQRWAGAIDSVGGHTLANLLAQTNYGGTVTSCGLAASFELPATVMPFILRAVNLTGINSVLAPRELRMKAWQRLASDLDTARLDTITTTVGLSDAQAMAERILAGDVRGRTVVDVRR